MCQLEGVVENLFVLAAVEEEGKEGVMKGSRRSVETTF